MTAPRKDALPPASATHLASAARELAAAVPDPEIPVLTIEDLGVLRGVEVAADGHVVVTVTPTYSGCPAMDAIRDEVARRLQAAGFAGAEVRTVLSPAWSTDWLSEEGRRKLSEAGIAPPGPASPPAQVAVSLRLRCPRCGSAEVRLVSRFGATACKAIHACRTCGEPFEEMKAV